MYVGQPDVWVDYQRQMITPQECRLRDITYSAEISVDIEYSRGRWLP